MIARLDATLAPAPERIRRNTRCIAMADNEAGLRDAVATDLRLSGFDVAAARIRLVDVQARSARSRARRMSDDDHRLIITPTCHGPAAVMDNLHNRT